MKEIHPIKIDGIWTEGYALDYHTVYSEYLGTDQWGHDQFDTKRTDLGQLLYELKYRKDLSKSDEIIALIRPFLLEWGIANKIDYIIPVPPSKERSFQPVFELCKKIGERLNKPVLYNIIVKNNAIQSKNLGTGHKNELSGTIIRKKRFLKKINLLIVDDLYQSGGTLIETTKVLKNDLNINNIYVLTMTKARR